MTGREGQKGRKESLTRKFLSCSGMTLTGPLLKSIWEVRERLASSKSVGSFLYHLGMTGLCHSYLIPNYLLASSPNQRDDWMGFYSKLWKITVV